MEPTNSMQGGRRLRSPEEINKLLEDYENSDGISVKEYCEMIGISDATFYNWQKRYGQVKEEGQGPNFIPVQIAETTQTQSVHLEVRVLKFYGPVCVEQFKALLS
jgi:transposase-like protein